jgi:hypothetical protein
MSNSGGIDDLFQKIRPFNESISENSEEPGIAAREESGPQLQEAHQVIQKMLRREQKLRQKFRKTASPDASHFEAKLLIKLRQYGMAKTELTAQLSRDHAQVARWIIEG